MRATVDVQFVIADANISESHDQAENFTKICNLKMSFTTKVKDLEATEPVQDSPSRELAAAQREIEKEENEFQIEEGHISMVERGLDKSESEPKPAEQTDIAQLRLEKVMLLHQVNNLTSEKSSLESKLRAFEHVIQRLKRNYIHSTLASNTFQPLPGPFMIRGFSELSSVRFGMHCSSEPITCPCGRCGISVKSSNLPTCEGKRILDDVTALHFRLE
jgi:hypothetical protein